MATDSGPIIGHGRTASVRDNLMLEDLALQLTNDERFVEARSRAGFMWRSIAGKDPDSKAWERFDAMLDEYAFNAALKGANSDPNYPKMLWALYCAPHRWYGRDIPGSRLGGDNPDNHYSLAPVDAEARFAIRGKLSAFPAADINFTLMGNTTLSKTLASIEGRDLAVEDDGSFLVTIGPDEANGRPNHLRSRAGARYVFIRESRSDWEQQPSTMEIVRLDPPSAPPHDLERMSQIAADIMVDDVPNTYWWMRLSLAHDVNMMQPPFSTAAVGGLHSQKVSFGHVVLEPRQAFVITVEAGGAGFRNLVLHDFWYRSMSVATHMSCLNTSQSAADADGRFTYVVSHDDPGVHNWLDPEGQRELLLVHRWQNLQREPGMAEPAIAGRIVPLAELDRHLPAGVARIDAPGRAAQIALRERQYALRFKED